jgi:hypothetical protein
VNVPFLPVERIRQYAEETLRLYQRQRGREDVFPLDAADLFDRLFGLPTIYDEEGVLNRQHGEGIVGSLFPDGLPSPWARDRVIVVNLTPTARFDPTARSEVFTILHEGQGHYVLHFLKGITGERLNRSFFCREIGEAAPRKPPLEWQADCAAGELMMPFDKVVWLLDRKRPPEMINLDLYEDHMMQYFGANRSIVEMRLKFLGYKLMNARYPWADWRQANAPRKSGKARHSSARQV